MARESKVLILLRGIPLLFQPKTQLATRVRHVTGSYFIGKCANTRRAAAAATATFLLPARTRARVCIYYFLAFFDYEKLFQ